ncbi:MAG: CRISPR system precrRNA processing endoribonuclease RAMP protein Cas6 [Cyanobacteria bacterium J06607_10]
MPQSLVLNLVTQSAIAPKYLQGYALQQLFFTLLDLVDPALGHILRRDKKNRAYSLSALQLTSPLLTPTQGNQSAQSSLKTSLQVSEKIKMRWPGLPKEQSTSRRQPNIPARLESLQHTYSSTIPAGTDCWWRISFLDDALFDHLIFLWNQLRNETFPLGPASVKIAHITADLPGLDWASSCSYPDLYKHASPYERDIHLRFMTPTAFESDGCTTPLPTADAIFQPLRKYWNRYSGLVFAPSLIANIAPTRFDIETQTAQLNLRNSFQMMTGCIGHISFRVGGKGDPLITKRINALADFTQYCSVGINTRFGMGIVKRTNGELQRSHNRRTI